ncbi:hypothetical protein GC194_04935 [bacterium]|nr:hypothetical protein [bacterium]
MTAINITPQNAYEEYHRLKAHFRKKYWKKYLEEISKLEEEFGIKAPLTARNDIRNDTISPILRLFHMFEHCLLEPDNIYGYTPHLYENIFQSLRNVLSIDATHTKYHILKKWSGDLERAKEGTPLNDPNLNESSKSFWNHCSLDFAICYLAEWEGLKDALFNEIERDCRGITPFAEEQEQEVKIDVNKLKFNSERWNKIDLIRLGIALQKLHFLQTEDGMKPTRKQVMNFISLAFGFDVRQYSSNYSHSKRDGNPTSLFEQMQNAIEQETDV